MNLKVVQTGIKAVQINAVGFKATEFNDVEFNAVEFNAVCCCTSTERNSSTNA